MALVAGAWDSSYTRRIIIAVLTGSIKYQFIGTIADIKDHAAGWDLFAASVEYPSAALRRLYLF
ncbi:MAG: hypothetical protein RR091_04755 [Cloacibacillus sp.]